MSHPQGDTLYPPSTSFLLCPCLIVLSLYLYGANAYRGGADPHMLGLPCPNCSLETLSALTQLWPGAMLACCWRGKTPSLPPPWVSTNVGTRARSPWTALARYVCDLGTPTLQTGSPTSPPEHSASLGQPHCVTYPGRALLYLPINPSLPTQSRSVPHACSVLPTPIAPALK